MKHVTGFVVFHNDSGIRASAILQIMRDRNRANKDQGREHGKILFQSDALPHRAVRLMGRKESPPNLRGEATGLLFAGL
jgi:hypothetical protein